MEEHLRALRSQWTATLPDSTTRAAARQAAGEKRLALLHERDHDALEATLRQQQLAFAALQSAVRRAPLFSRGQEIYDALHLDTSLGRDPLERAEQLQQHFERSMASVPSHVERLSTLELSDKAESKSTPQSKVSITGGENYTLVSSVFMAEIPHPSLDLVFAATRAYLQGLPSAVKRHVGANMDRKVMPGSFLAVDARETSGELIIAFLSVEDVVRLGRGVERQRTAGRVPAHNDLESGHVVDRQHGRVRGHPRRAGRLPRGHGR